MTAVERHGRLPARLRVGTFPAPASATVTAHRSVTDPGRRLTWRARTRVAPVALLAWTVLLGCVEAQVVPRTIEGNRAEPEAHAYRLVRWTTAEGLPQNTVNDMILLANGELWLATFGGLARFDDDGFHVVDIASDEGLPANRIVSLAVAGADAFWLLTQQGHLGRVERGRPVPLVPPPGVPADALSLSADRTGRLYCTLADGSIWQTDGRQPWAQVLGRQGPGGPLSAFATTEDGQTWTVWGDRLVRLDAGSAASSVPVPEPHPNVFRRVGGGLWLGLERGLARVVDGQVHRLDVRPPVADRVTAIESAESDSLWVASGSVVSRVELQPDGTWLRTALPLDLPEGRQLRSLLLDRRGSLWIGTNGYGLYRVNRLAARRFGAESGLGEITALAPDGGGGAFASSGCRGLFHVAASGHVTPIELRDPADAAGILGGECGISLGAGGGDRAWARSGSHLFLVRRRGLEVRRVPVILPDVEGPVAANPDGSVWVVSRTGVAHLVSLGGHVAREVPLPGPLMSASVGGDGSLWVGGDGAVFQVDRDGVRAFGPREHMPRGLVRDVVPEPDGTLWVGTYGGGVGRWRAGRFVRLTVEHGLPDNSVSRILDDGRGRMWISTNRGLAVVDRRNLHEVAEGRLRDLAPVVLGPERGVAEANFGSPAGFADTNGRLWFSTIDGVALVDAARFPFNATAPLVRIESVLADGRPLTVGEVVQVPRLTERVRVAFSAFELLYPERMRFRFRVEGVDADWVDVGPQRTADWTPPGPGEHRFLVEARNEDGVWSETPAAIVLDVIPAWWQTTAVRAAATLAAVVATVGAFGVRVRRIERRHAERLRVLEEQRNAERRVAELRAQLEHVARVALAGELAGSLAHEVSQPIGAMVNNAEAGRRHLTQYLQHPEQIGAIFDDIVADGMRASEVIRGLRGFLRPRRAAISRVDLSDLVREMLPLVRRELTEGHVRTELSLDDALPPIEGYRVQLGQVVVNLVMNACEALVEIAADRQIGVSTAVRDGRVELAVRDNGPGLAPEVAAHVFEPFVTTKPGGLGMGLAICRAIAEAHGGHLRAVPVPGGGLEVTLSLPAAPTEAFPP